MNFSYCCNHCAILISSNVTKMRYLYENYCVKHLKYHAILFLNLQLHVKTQGGLCMKIILVSHGPFSKGLLESVQMVLGEQEDLAAHCLMPEETPGALFQRLEAEIGESKGDDILFLTDLYHGSPFNVVVSLMKDHKFRHITGINMPLLIDAIMSRNGGHSAEEVCSRLVELAPGTILDVNDLLKKEDMEE